MIGLIFGETEFPKKILSKLKQENEKYIIIDLSKKNFFKNNPYSQSFSLGQFSKIFKFLLENKSSIVLVGEFEEAFILKVKSSSVLNVVIDNFYSKGMHENAILLFQGDFDRVDFKMETMRSNEVLSEKSLLNKFL